MAPKHGLTLGDLEEIAELRFALRRFQSATDRVTIRHGLTSRQYDLLAALHAPSRAGAVASAIAGDLSISRNAMTELVSRAELAGLVSRQADDGDARRKPLVPTADGSRRYLAAATELHVERRQLLRALRRAARQVESNEL